MAKNEELIKEGINKNTVSSTTSTSNIILISFIVLISAIVFINQYQINSISKNLVTGGIAGGTSSTISAISGIDVIPKGVPNIYGKELTISFDDISANNPSKADQTISRLGAYDNQIQLSGEFLQRYIKIAGAISCEYCCGAESIIFTKSTGNYKAGDAACGCAHSYAMRGLAKYLLKNHAGEYTDDQILEELGKWKTLFFPGVMTQKAGVLKEKGIELNYINLASNKYRGIEQGSSSGGSMVGGC